MKTYLLTAGEKKCLNLDNNTYKRLRLVHAESLRKAKAIYKKWYNENVAGTYCRRILSADIVNLTLEFVSKE